MKHIFAGIIITVLAAGCGTKKSQDQENAAQNIVIKPMIPESGCYALLTSADSVWLKTEVFPNVVTGILKYRISGKDRNSGTIEGKFYGDTLIADYSFHSEGRLSVRQVAFLLRDSSLVEGYGDTEEQDGKFIFSNIHEIDFSRGLKLQRISCVENDEAFQVKGL